LIVLVQGNGLVVGTSWGADFRNITFRNCTAIGTAYGCHIKFKENQTGSCKNVSFEDIVVHSPYRYALGIDQNGQSTPVEPTFGGDGESDHIIVKNNISSNNNTPAVSTSHTTRLTLGSNVTINDIVFRNVRATNATHGGKFECNTGHLSCHGIVLEGVDFGTTQDCEMQNVYGSGSDVHPPSCIPPQS